MQDSTSTENMNANGTASHPHAAEEAPAASLIAPETASAPAPEKSEKAPAPEAQPVPGALIEWHDMTPGEQLTAWAQLRAFVTWLTDRYELTVEDRIPRCWARHPGLVEELWALRAWRTEIYSGTLPSAGQPARYWHAELERVINAARTRYAPGCRAGHRGADGLVAVDRGLQQAWAESNMLAGVPPVDVAAGRAKYAGTWVSPQDMAAAVDSGEAARVDGLRDYLQYRGSWWVPGSGGWTLVPAPSVPAQVHGPRGEIRDD